MKSKISFFNKTIYFKNITLFWPIWVIYLLYLLVTGPVLIALEFNMYTRKDLKEMGVGILTNYLDPQLIIVTSFIVAIIVAMALYNYLYVGKNANMIHSLPITRMELFGTNLLSGLTFLFVPQIITFMCSVFVCLGYGVTAVEYLGVWLLISMGVSFLFFSIAVFCAFLTGQLFALPLYYVALNFLYEFLQVIVGMVMDFCGFGIDFTNMVELMKLHGLSPALFLYNNVYLQPNYTEDLLTGEWIYKGMICEGGKYVAWYIIPAIILLVIAYLFYQKHHIESAGDWVTVSFLKPVFRWGIGLSCGYFFGIGFSVILGEFYIGLSRVAVFISILIMGIVFFFISEMFLQKSFKVFKKKRVAEMGIFAGFMLVSYLGIQGGIYMMEEYVPAKEKVDYATIEINYSMDVDGEELDRVLEIHQMIVDHREEFKDLTFDDNVGGYWIPITYRMKNGEFVRRDYWLPWCQQSEAIFNKVTQVENEPENYLNYLFGNPYEDALVTGGYMDFYSMKDGVEDWGSIDFTPSDAQILYEAAIKDAQTGALQKYNQQSYYEEMAKEDEEIWKERYQANICLYLFNRSLVDDGSAYDDYYYDYYGYYINDGYYQTEEYETSAWFSIGKDCTNIIQALTEIGAIDSENDFQTQWEVMEQEVE